MFMGDKETFKLLLFFHGNGCNPEIISRWIEHDKYNLSTTTLIVKDINGFTTTLV